MNTGEKQSKTAFVEELLEKIWKTKGARFNAHRRLKAQSRQSLSAISWLSAYLLILSILCLTVLKLSATQSQIVNFGSSAMAIFILVLSILESAKEYSLRSEKLHQCGMLLSGLYDEIKVVAEGKPNSKKLQLFSERYQNILVKASENHDTIDYNYFQAQNPKDFNLTRSQIVNFKFIWLLRTYAFYKIVIVTPPILALLIFLNKW